MRHRDEAGGLLGTCDLHGSRAVYQMGMTRSSSSSLRRDGARGRAGAGGGPASRAAAVQPSA